MKNRERQRQNRKIKQQLLKYKDICGVNDPTPFDAVKRMIESEKSSTRKEVI